MLNTQKTESEETSPKDVWGEKIENTNRKKWMSAVKYLSIIFFLLAMVALIAWVKGLFAETETSEIMKILSDSFAIPGILTLCAGLLIVCSNGGAFDMLSYGVRSLFALFLRNPAKRKHRTFYDYRKEQQGKNRSFRYLIFIGAAFTAVAVVFTILYNKYAV